MTRKEDLPIEEIVHRLRTTGVTITALRREYGCAYQTMALAICDRIGYAEYAAIAASHTRVNSGSFRAGHEPWNKGLIGFDPGGRSHETRFVPGAVRGQAARKWRPLGAISVRHDQPPRRWRGHANARPGPPRQYIKVRDDGPPKDRWIPLARYLWQKAYGPIPPGMLVAHINGNAMDDSLENLVLINRRVNMLRLPPDVWALRKARASEATRRRHAVNRARPVQPRRRRQCSACAADVETDRCPKCGSLSIETITIHV